MPTLIEWPAANPLLPPTALQVLREDLCGRQRRPQRLGVGLILHLCNSIWRNLRQYKVLFVVSLCQIWKYSRPERLEEPYIQLYPCISKYTIINTRHVTQEFFFFKGTNIMTGYRKIAREFLLSTQNYFCEYALIEK